MKPKTRLDVGSVHLDIPLTNDPRVTPVGRILIEPVLLRGMLAGWI